MTKVIIITPAGRKNTLSILKTWLERSFTLFPITLFHEWHLLVNTKDKNDLDYIKELTRNNPWIKAVEHNPTDIQDGIAGIGTHLVNYPWEDNTIYLRLDDDIVYIPPYSIAEVVNTVVNAESDVLFVSCNVINNAICAYYQQQNNLIPKKFGIIQPLRGCPLVWNTPKFTEKLHYKFINTLDFVSLSHTTSNKNYFEMPDYVLTHNQIPDGISTNAIAFFGKNIKKAISICKNGFLHREERAISIDAPKELEMKIMIAGKAIVSHYSFFTQKEYLDNNTDILLSYKHIAEFG